MKYIGIDGGGTKTKFSLFNEEGKKEKDVLKPTVHILNQSEEKCVQYLKEGVNELDPDQNCYVVAGLAGYGQQKELRDKIQNVCNRAFGKRQFSLYNDVEIAVQGALNGEDGIVVIAGTGSIALSNINHKFKRCGGWGYQLGDEGSAFWIVKKMLSVYCRQIDGRLEKTQLYDILKKECRLINDYDIITFMNNLNNDRSSIASLAYIAAMAADCGDPHVLQIYQEAAYEISLLIRTLAKEFSSPFKVSYIGGVFNAGYYILNPLKEQLKFLPCELISPIHSPEYGAFMLGKIDNYKEKRK